MSNYNSTLQSNNTDLQAILNQINELPEAGGVELPELSNEGSASDLLSGKQLIDGDGNKITGTFTIDSELATQDNLISQIQAAVDNLPDADSSGSSSGGTAIKTCIVSISSTQNLLSVGCTKSINGTLSAYCSDTATTSLTIDNILCGSMLYIVTEFSAVVIPTVTLSDSSQLVKQENINNNNEYYILVIQCGSESTLSVDIVYPTIATCCFVAGTQVLTTLDGQTKNIEDVEVGENVVSYNIETGENYITEVIRTIVHEDTTDIAEVIFDNGNSLTMNAYHPLYCDGGFKSITRYNGYDELVVGDRVKTVDNWSTITEIKRYNSEPIITYNLDVRDINENPDIDTNDNYYANGIVVKNRYC